MRKDDDDLAAALPPSLTVDLDLPEPVHEAPPDEAVVALDEVAVTPAPSPAVPTISIEVTTTSIEVTTMSAPGAGSPAEAGEAPVPEQRALFGE